MSETGEQSANLSAAEAERLFPGLLARQTKQVRWLWKKRGVPWDVIGPRLLALKRAQGDGLARRPQRPPSPDILTAPEGAMKDATFREVWARVTLVWKHRKDRPIQWQALVQNVQAFTDGLEGEPPTAPGKTRRIIS